MGAESAATIVNCGDRNEKEPRTTMFIDTHTHLYDGRYQNDEREMIRRALDAGVSEMYIPNCDHTTIDDMMRLCGEWPQQLFPMMGLHPCYVKEDVEQELATVREWLDKARFAAVGEIGLDYYWDKTFVSQQKEAFTLQIGWALEHNLPIVIHSRESTRDCIDIVRSKQNGHLGGIFHCFSGTPEEAREVVSLGFYLGIGGVVTYKNNILREIVREMPLESIVLETDAPYLTPVPHRGKRNESAYIRLIADTIAELKGVPVATVAAITTSNAEKIFKNRG